MPSPDLRAALAVTSLARHLACVARSTGPRTTLRPAGAGSARQLDGDYEIVSLTGTLSVRRPFACPRTRFCCASLTCLVVVPRCCVWAQDTGHHLHMSLSDKECRTYGGHVLEGCMIRTTAEIALGVVEGVAFNRPVDSRTGFKELSVDEVGKREGSK